MVSRVTVLCRDGAVLPTQVAADDQRQRDKRRVREFARANGLHVETSTRVAPGLGLPPLRRSGELTGCHSRPLAHMGDEGQSGHAASVRDAVAGTHKLGTVTYVKSASRWPVSASQRRYEACLTQDARVVYQGQHFSTLTHWLAAVCGRRVPVL